MGDLLHFPFEARWGDREQRKQDEAAANIYWLAERLNLRKKEEDCEPPSDTPLSG